MEFLLRSEEETQSLGTKLGAALQAGDILCLDGDLGAGKTTLTKAIAKAMGIEDHVTSPTFTIVQEYEGTLPLYHFDVYRVGDLDEFFEIGYEDYFDGRGVCIVEWAKQVEDALPPRAIRMELHYGTEPTHRLAKVTIDDPEVERRIEEAIQ